MTFPEKSTVPKQRRDNATIVLPQLVDESERRVVANRRRFKQINQTVVETKNKFHVYEVDPSFSMAESGMSMNSKKQLGVRGSARTTVDSCDSTDCGFIRKVASAAGQPAYRRCRAGSRAPALHDYSVVTDWYTSQLDFVV